MTKAQQAVEDTKVVGKKAGKVLKIVWMIIVIVVMSAWLIAGMLWLTSFFTG